MPRPLPRLAALVALVVLSSACIATGNGGDAGPAGTVGRARPATTSAPPTTGTTTTTTTTTSTTATTSTTPTTTTTEPPRPEGVVPATTVGRPWGTVTGLTMFRGNPTRTWYGTGPLPADPGVLWRYPERAMCGESSVAGETTTWCGTGWTGQPVVWERPDGVTEVIFGAYDKSVHFVDAATGRPTRAAFLTGDIIKGSVTLDPDGYPLIYFGSRDNKLRVVAIDGETPRELWALDANAVRGIWNNDWDGNPVVLDDVLYEGGENSWFFAVKLNRAYASDGSVVVEPEVLVAVPGYDDLLLSRVGRNVSIESSVALFEDRAYFANSGGRVVGLDLSRVHEGEAPVVFDYWMGDDTDATVVVDADGMLYVAAELERFNSRSEEVGQLVKLDPYTDADPLLWSVPVPPQAPGPGGLWATPALGDGVLYAATHPGELLAVDTATGEVLWRDDVGWHAWSSPVIVGEELLVATCSGELRAYSISDPRSPVPIWTLALESGSCLESTPAVWQGRVYVGSRDGYFYAIGD